MVHLRFSAPNLTGGFVNYEGKRSWTNGNSAKKRRGQLRFHFFSIREKIMSRLPSGTRFVIAVWGNMQEAQTPMFMCYQATSEMMFDDEWSTDTTLERPSEAGWLIMERGET